MKPWGKKCIKWRKVSSAVSHKAWPSLRRFSRKSQTLDGITWRFHPNVSRNMEIIDRHSFISSSILWLSLNRFSENFVLLSKIFLISNFRRVLNVVCFLLGNSPALNFICRPACEDGTDCSETSAYKIQAPGIYPEKSIQVKSWRNTYTKFHENPTLISVTDRRANCGTLCLRKALFVIFIKEKRNRILSPPVFSYDLAKPNPPEMLLTRNYRQRLYGKTFHVQ